MVDAKNDNENIKAYFCLPIVCHVMKKIIDSKILEKNKVIKMYVNGLSICRLLIELVSAIHSLTSASVLTRWMLKITYYSTVDGNIGLCQ